MSASERFTPEPQIGHDVLRCQHLACQLIRFARFQNVQIANDARIKAEREAENSK